MSFIDEQFLVRYRALMREYRTRQTPTANGGVEEQPEFVFKEKLWELFKSAAEAQGDSVDLRVPVRVSFEWREKPDPESVGDHLIGYQTYLMVNDQPVGRLQKLRLTVGADSVMPSLEVTQYELPEGDTGVRLEALKERLPWMIPTTIPRPTPQVETPPVEAPPVAASEPTPEAPPSAAG
jgi:hypothetical protein